MEFSFRRSFTRLFNKKLLVQKLRNALVVNVSLSKVAMINTTFLLHHIFFNNFKNRKIYSKSSNFNYLIDYDYTIFTKKKGPKILYLSNMRESDNSKLDIESYFTKIHSKYKDLESYMFKLTRYNGEELSRLLESYGTTIGKVYDLQENEDGFTIEDLEKIEKRPFIFLNKYGDVKCYSTKEFEDVSKAETIYNYFEKMSILHSKNDLLLMNDYDYLFVIYLDNKQIDYQSPIFQKFRKIYFSINFFNIKFFVATPQHSDFFKPDGKDPKENTVYLVKRHNMISDHIEAVNKQMLHLDNEVFEAIDLTENLIKIDPKTNESKKLFHNLDKFTLEVNKLLINLTNFILYTNNSFKKKQGLEVLNLFFKDIPYYLLYTNLREKENRQGMIDILNIFKEEFPKFKENFAFIVVDNERVIEVIIFRTVNRFC